MTSALWVAIVVAGLGASSGIVAAVLGRRTDAEDGPHARLLAEVRYLADQLADVRLRAQALEDDVRACHTERAHLEARVAHLEGQP